MNPFAVRETKGAQALRIILTHITLQIPFKPGTEYTTAGPIDPCVCPSSSVIRRLFGRL